MLDKIVAAVCIVVCAAACVWGLRWENGSEKKAGKKDDDQANEKVKNDKEDKSDI